MSTKIYNGYYTKLKLEPLLLKLKEVLIEFNKLKIEGYTKFLSNKITKEIDKKYFKGEDFLQKNIVHEIYKKHTELVLESQKTHMRLLDEFDFSANCCIFPCGNKTLILFYSDNKDVLNMWENLDFIFDYHYQNSCDKPDDISKREWKSREKNWDKVLGGNGWGVPSQNGYTFTLSEIYLPNIYSIKNDLKNYIPSDDYRATKIIQDKYIESKFQEIKKNEDISDKEVSVYFEIIDMWNEYNKTDLFKIELDELKTKLIEITF